MEPDLKRIFEELNQAHFGGALAQPVLRWNSRLRTSAGRFTPGGRALFSAKPPLIEVARYLLTEQDGLKHIQDTMGHEMIHYWLWSRRRPYGHTPEFWDKLKETGGSRYNPVPRRRPAKYLYRCPSCLKDFPARKKLRKLACARCCKLYAGGRYDSRYALMLVDAVPKPGGLDATTGSVV